MRTLVKILSITTWTGLVCFIFGSIAAGDLESSQGTHQLVANVVAAFGSTLLAMSLLAWVLVFTFKVYKGRSEKRLLTLAFYFYLLVLPFVISASVITSLIAALSFEYAHVGAWPVYAEFYGWWGIFSSPLFWEIAGLGEIILFTIAILKKEK